MLAGEARPRAGRRRRAISIALGAALVAVLVVVVYQRREDFVEALASASLVVLLVATLLQSLALLVRSDAWYVCVGAAGGRVGRRRIYRAASVGYLASQLNAQVGTAARIAALRRGHPEDAPRVPALVASEVPILVIEGAFGAIASFTLIGPLGLPWWSPIVFLVLVVAVMEGLRRLSRTDSDGWRAGLAVLRSLDGRNRTIALMSVAITAQILRNWLLLHAVGVDASIFDATAVLIAMATIAQLPVGPGTGAGATVLILGSEGVGAVAAAGVLLTATGTLGALLYVAVAAADGAWAKRRELRSAVGLPETASGDREGRLDAPLRPPGTAEPVLAVRAGDGR